MAVVKISELPAMQTIAGSDLLPIVDTSETETKKVTKQMLLTDIDAGEVKIGQLTEATQINDDDLLIITQNGVNKKISKANAKFASGDEIFVGNTLPSGDDADSIKLWLTSDDALEGEGSYISNTYGTSQAIGYSQEYANKNLTYSTTEIDTGKRWTDGKKIYRKVIEGTTPSTAGTWGNVGSLTFSKLISLTGILGNYLPVPCYVNSNYLCSLQCSGSNIQAFVQGYTSNAIKVIVEYTKD